MKGIVGFLIGFFELFIAVAIIIALLGAIVSLDVVFKVAGGIGLIWFVRHLIKSLKAHNVNDPHWLLP